MPTERLLAILELLSKEEDADQPRALCSVAARFTNLSGAGVTLASAGPHYTTYCTSNEVARQLLDAELTLREGPGIDACQFDAVTEESDLLHPKFGRWIAYAPAAVTLGAQAVFGFPIRIGAIRIGALTLYRESPGPLSERQESDAYLVTSVVGRAILAMRAGASRSELTNELGASLAFDFSVHQAAGMVSVQGDMSLDDAYVALRAHAFGAGISVAILAERVLQRETQYLPSSQGWIDVETETIG